ncbi:hypothetical protein [Sulfurovum sp.]|uniref:hypothetical protein n=1 Tax=Sulfurovum sp. TaxID=1969726 RepID=UPI0025EF0E0F|nr:hypothetical protein [Sulfurovum sp.]
MKKTTLITVSLAAAAALAMTGCGSSSGSNNPTPAPTAAPTVAPSPAPTNTPAPTPTPDPDVQPAPVNKISVQQLLINMPTVQTTNRAMAITQSVSSAVSAMVTQFIVNGLLAPVNGDLPCATLGVNQGSGSIHGTASTLPQGGNSYKIDFNECSFDTLTTLSASTDNNITDLNVSECTGLITQAKAFMRDENGSIDATEKVSDADFATLKDGAAACVTQLNDINATGDTAKDLKAALGVLTQVTALSDQFAQNYQIPTLGSLAALNDILTINGSIYAEVNLSPLPAGNIWTTKFSGSNYDMTLTDNSATVTKFNAKINGDMTGKLNVVPFVGGYTAAPNVETSKSLIEGTNNMTSSFMVNSANLNLFIDASIVGKNATYSSSSDMTLDKIDPATGTFYTTQWQQMLKSSMNDSGDGKYTATLVDHSTGYEGIYSLYNKNFEQNRVVETDPSAVPNTGVARKSTYSINGQYAINTKGTPFIWNTMGAFTISTTNTAVKTKTLNGAGTDITAFPAAGSWDYTVQSGDITIAGTAPIDFKFLPDASANPSNGNGLTDGSIVMSVGGDVVTLPANMWTWLEVMPQP